MVDDGTPLQDFTPEPLPRLWYSHGVKGDVMRWVLLAIVYLAALVQLVSADCGTASSDYIISSSDDVSPLTSCVTYTGSIVVAPPTHPGGPAPTAQISEWTLDIGLDGIEEVGGFAIRGAVGYNTTIRSDSLQRIGDGFDIDGFSGLVENSTVDFPQLTRVGSINFTNIGDNTYFSFPAGITAGGNVTFSNIDTDSLYWINIIEVGNTLLCEGAENSSGAFTSLSWPLKRAYAISIIGYSHFNVTLNQLENVTDSLSFDNVTAVSVPVLKGVGRLFSLTHTGLVDFAAGQLSSVGHGGIIVDDNPNLEDVSFPALEEVGSIEVLRNPNLDSINFNETRTMNGSVYMEGNFSTASMPSVEHVDGTFYLVSDNPSMNCSAFAALVPSAVLDSSVHACEVNLTSYNAVGSSASSSPSSSGGSSGGLSTGAKAGVGVGVSLGALALVGLGCVLYRLGQRQGKDKRGNGNDDDDNEKSKELEAERRAELPDGEDPTEVEGRAKFELPADKEVYELPSEQGVVEVESPGVEKGRIMELPA
ncbi:hypothetical protein BDY21DRAFT_379396 [Lineolata rhizophorae]|uniref:Uncharacterized protein n=1 Tax=Lineolata rhizophorae TaxID=578093 RepID=A0A6A6NZ62_9PEZI|nr:hypothetical protein BDY21DRAFT_379396 [Lineolata rhizophorae]